LRRVLDPLLEEQRQLSCRRYARAWGATKPGRRRAPGGGKKGSFLPHAARKGGDACRRGARD
jgi:hypothetical protein